MLPEKNTFEFNEADLELLKESLKRSYKERFELLSSYQSAN
jgi:hypothetical protein